MEFENKPSGEVRFVPQFANILGESVLPPSYDPQERLTVEEFEEKYPVRSYLFSEFSTLRSDFSKEALQKIKALGKYLHMLNRADEYIIRHLKGNQTLWPDQFRAFCGIKEGLEKGETDGSVKIPTSGGKTILFTEFIEAIGVKTTNNEDFRTLIVVPDRKPVKQTKEKMELFAPDLPVGVVYGNKKDIGEKEKPVTVITDESLNIQLKNGAVDPLRYDLLVLDEADVYLSKRKQEDISKFANATRVGFSATMEFSREKKVSNYLPYPYFEMDIKEGVENDDLSPFTVLHAYTTADISNVHIRAGEFMEDELTLMLDIETRNQAAIDLYGKMFSGKAGIIYCLGVSHAQRLAELFNDNGVKAAYISGYMTEKEQDEIYAKYRNNEIDVLCNSDILIRSFDEPRAEVCFNLRPTMSKVVAEQRAGRVLRKDPNNPSKHAYIVDFIDQNKDSRKQQILFAQIAGSAHIDGKSSSSSNNSSKTTEPAQLPDIQIDGLKVVTDTEEVMRVVNKEDINPPEGWILAKDVADKIGRSITYVYHQIEIYSRSHPQLIGQFLDNFNRPATYFSPQIISLMGEKFEGIETIPEGAMSRSRIEDVYGKGGINALNKLIDEGHRPQTFFSENNTRREYFLPETIAEIEKILGPLQEVPEDMFNVKYFADLLGARFSWVKSHLEKIAETHPELATGTYRSNRFKSRRVMYYSGDFFEYLVERRSKVKTTQTVQTEQRKVKQDYSELMSGYVPVFQLPEVQGMAKNTISKRAQRIMRNGGPIEKRLYPGEGVVYVVPKDLSSDIGNAISSKVFKLNPDETIHENVPEGMVTISQLAKRVNISYITLSRYVRKLMETDERVKFEKVMGVANNDKTYIIQTDLALEIEQHFSDLTSMPDGFILIKDLANELDITPTAIQHRWAKRKKSNPLDTWYGVVNLNGSGTRAGAISPAFADEIRGELAKEIVSDDYISSDEVAARFNIPHLSLRMKLHKLVRGNHPSVKKTGYNAGTKLYIKKGEEANVLEGFIPETGNFLTASELAAKYSISIHVVKYLMTKGVRAKTSGFKKGRLIDNPLPQLLALEDDFAELLANHRKQSIPDGYVEVFDIDELKAVDRKSRNKRSTALNAILKTSDKVIKARNNKGHLVFAIRKDVLDETIELVKNRISEL